MTDSTHRESRGPAIESRGDLGMLVSADYSWRHAQICCSAVIVILPLFISPFRKPDSIRYCASFHEESA